MYLSDVIGENDGTCANRSMTIEFALVHRRSVAEMEADNFVARGMVLGIAVVMDLSHTLELDLDWCCMNRLYDKDLSHTLLGEHISHEA